MADSATEPIRFRPSAKRKAYRQRNPQTDTDTDDHPQNQDTPAPDDTPANREGEEKQDGHDDDDTETAALAALRARNTRKGRLLQGVGFRSGGGSSGSTGDVVASGPLVLAHRGSHDDGEEQDEEDAEAAANPLLSITSRFTHQTGIMNDIDHRHMNAYIESRLSGRRQPNQPDHDEDNAPDHEQDPARNGPERPIIQGKIVEVEIKDEQRRSTGAGEGRVTKKQRIGPDGKPWRPRKRRGSDDVKRDQLVEEFLHENRLDIYNVPTQAAANDDEADGEADKRLADEFRRQYMDDVARRRQQRKKKPVQAPKPRAENVLRGPKLGGSRNARAAVRDILLQQNKDGKK